MYIAGTQPADGPVTRVINLGVEATDDINPDKARELAATLIAAADELDRLV